MRALLLTVLLLVASLLPAAAQDQVIGEFTVGGQTIQIIARPKQVIPPPPPPPPPFTRQVYGIQRESDNEWVREVKAGEVLRLWGENLGTTPGKVWLPWILAKAEGLGAEVIEWTNAYIIARVGRIERNTIGTVRAAHGNWEALAPFDVSVTPADDPLPPPPPPPPPPPGIAPVTTGYVGRFGEPVKIIGTGFGAISGRVWQGGVPVEVIKWTDTEIVVTSRGTVLDNDNFTVQRPDNDYVAGQARPVAPGVRR